MNKFSGPSKDEWFEFDNAVLEAFRAPQIDNKLRKILIKIFFLLKKFVLVFLTIGTIAFIVLFPILFLVNSLGDPNTSNSILGIFYLSLGAAIGTGFGLGIFVIIGEA